MSEHLQGPWSLLKDLKHERIFGGGHRVRKYRQPLGDECCSRLTASNEMGASFLQQLGTEFN